MEAPEVASKFNTKKNVVVLAASLNENESSFLNKILNAVKLSLEVVELVSHPIELADLTSMKSVKYVISFGNLIQKNTLTINNYKPVLLDGKTFIFADEVASVAKNKNKEKADLWNALKETFLK